VKLLTRPKEFLLLLFTLMLLMEMASASNLLKNGDLEGADTSEFTPLYAQVSSCTVILESDGNRCAKLVINKPLKMDPIEVSSSFLIGGIKGSEGTNGSNAIRVKPNTTYEFGFDIKGNVGLLRAPKLFVWTEENVTEKKGRTEIATTLLSNIEVTDEWERYEGEVTTNATAYTAGLRLPVYYIRGDAEDYNYNSYLLVDNVVFREKEQVDDDSGSSEISINSFPLSITSSINTISYSSPETGLKTVNRLTMSSRPVTLNNIIDFQIYWLYESIDDGFENWKERKPRPYLFYGNGIINLDGPLFPGFKPIKVSLGRVFISYSPYVAKLNYDYAKKAYGISFSNVVWQNINCSGFFVWENDSSKRYSLLGDCLRLRTSIKSWSGDMILVRHREGPPIFNYGRLPDFGVTKELAQQFKLNYKINLQSSIEALWIDQYNYLGSTTTKVNARKIDLKTKSQSNKLDFSFWNFDENFGPRYRSTAPEFLYNEENRREGVNPIDLYKNQQGYNLGLARSFKASNMELSLKRYRHVNREKPFSSNIKWFLENPKHRLTVLLSQDHKKSFNYQEYAWEMVLAKDQAKTIKGNLVYINDLTKYNNDLFSSEPIKELSMEIDFKKGLIPGLILRGGLQCAAKNYWYLRTKFKLLNNLEVRVYWRNNNVVEQLTQIPPEIYVSNDGTFWCDEFNRIHYPDNHIRIQSKVTF